MLALATSKKSNIELKSRKHHNDRVAPNPLLVRFLSGYLGVASVNIDLINLGASFGFSFLHIA